MILLAFVNVVKDVLTGDSTAGDRLLLQRAYLLAISQDGQWMTPWAKLLSMAGNWQGMIPLGLLLLWLGWRGHLPWRAFRCYLLGCVGTGAVVLVLKHLIARPRPAIVPPLEDAPFASFPSGHSAYAVMAYGFAFFLLSGVPQLPRWLKWIAGLLTVLLVVLIGLSRIYLATHYPTDVAAGLLIGILWLLAVLAYYQRGEDR